MQYKITFLPNGEQEGRAVNPHEENTEAFTDWDCFEYDNAGVKLPAYGFPEERIYNNWECQSIFYGLNSQALIYIKPSEKKEEKDLIDRQELVDQVKSLTEEYADYFAHMETRIGFTAVLIDLINNQPKQQP